MYALNVVRPHPGRREACRDCARCLWQVSHQREQVQMATSDLEETFIRLWPIVTGNAAPPEREYRFHADRRWRFDFAWPTQRVAVEAEGGTWSGGRHVRGSGFEADVEKYNTAAATGWRIFRCTSKMMKENPAGFITMVQAALDLSRGGR